MKTNLKVCCGDREKIRLRRGSQEFCAKANGKLGYLMATFHSKKVGAGVVCVSEQTGSGSSEG